MVPTPRRPATEVSSTTIGPSQRLRSAGTVRCAQTTAASPGSVDSTSRTIWPSAASSLRWPPSACQRVSRSQTNVETLPRSSSDSVAAVSPSATGSSPSASTAAAVKRAKPADLASAATAPLSNRWTRIDLAAGEFVPTGDTAVDVGAVVDEELEVEAWCQPTGCAVAARASIDAPEPASEGEVRGLDGVDEERAIGAPVLDEEEAGIALELGESEGRIEASHDGLEQVAGDHRSVLEFATSQVGGMAGEIGEDEEPGLWGDSHRRTVHLGAAPMSIAVRSRFEQVRGSPRSSRPPWERAQVLSGNVPSVS